jgi:hypothetical protein
MRWTPDPEEPLAIYYWGSVIIKLWAVKYN